MSNRTFITLEVPQNFAKELLAASHSLGVARTDFIKMAAMEKMKNMGFKIPRIVDQLELKNDVSPVTKLNSHLDSATPSLVQKEEIANDKR
jgi:hypothetical protein